jgi:hypothetical protein
MRDAEFLHQAPHRVAGTLAAVFYCVLLARLRTWGKFRSRFGGSKPDLQDLSQFLCYSQRSTEPPALLGHAPNPVYGFGTAV